MRRWHFYRSGGQWYMLDRATGEHRVLAYQGRPVTDDLLPLFCPATRTLIEYMERRP